MRDISEVLSELEEQEEPKEESNDGLNKLVIGDDDVDYDDLVVVVVVDSNAGWLITRR